MGDFFVVREASVASNAHSDSKIEPLSYKNTIPWKVSL